MSTTPQKRALKRYRERLHEKGMARFEVLGRTVDRELIRLVARRLAAEDPSRSSIRATLRQAMSGNKSKKGGILDALRRSPLVGAGVHLKRAPVQGCKVDL